MRSGRPCWCLPSSSLTRRRARGFSRASRQVGDVNSAAGGGRRAGCELRAARRRGLACDRGRAGHGDDTREELSARLVVADADGLTRRQMLNMAAKIVASRLSDCAGSLRLSDNSHIEALHARFVHGCLKRPTTNSASRTQAAREYSWKPGLQTRSRSRIVQLLARPRRVKTERNRPGARSLERLSCASCGGSGVPRGREAGSVIQ